MAQQILLPSTHGVSRQLLPAYAGPCALMHAHPLGFVSFSEITSLLTRTGSWDSLGGGLAAVLILISKPLVGFLFLLAPRLLSSLFPWAQMDSPLV